MDTIKQNRQRDARRIVVALGAVVLVAAALPHRAAVAARPAIAPHAPAAKGPGGDIPDSAVYLRYAGRGFTIEYVEGWLQTRTAQGVIFSDKDSSVTAQLDRRVAGSLTTYVGHTVLPRLMHTAGFHQMGIGPATIATYSAVHLSYRNLSTPDAVTGKTVTLQTDRYYVNGPRALAVLTLSTPLGVDNIDGFRRIARSFRFH